MPPAIDRPRRTAATVLQESEAPRDAMGPCGEASRRRSASCSWALLVARTRENRPLQCPRGGCPLRILAFILEREVIDKILRHIGERWLNFPSKG